MVEREEMKNYLRIDFDDDDRLIDDLILTSRRLCLDILRSDDETLLESIPTAKTAILYSVAYLYENREDADYHELAMNLRALLFSEREGVF